MSIRGASTAVQTEIAKASNSPLHLLELYLDTQTVYMTDSYRDISWGGNIYTAVGELLDFSGVEETSDMKVAQANISLSGVDQTMIALFLQNNYIDRRLIVRKAFLDGNESVIVDPFPILDGRCDTPAVHEDPAQGTCTVSLVVAGAFIDFERNSGRHTNHQEQQVYFPGDMGFEFVSQLNTNIKWGAA